MRQWKERDYSHLFVETVDEEDADDTQEFQTPQMSMKRGIKLFREDGVAAVRKEMQQLHDRKLMAAKHSDELTPEQKKEALAYLMFLKQKWCGKIKGHGCADGRKQHAHIACEDAASPTVATQSVFLTAMINALEG